MLAPVCSNISHAHEVAPAFDGIVIRRCHSNFVDKIETNKICFYRILKNNKIEEFVFT